MVHPFSTRISRVPAYLFACLVLQSSFVYGTFTLYCQPSQVVLLTSLINHARLFPLRSPLLRESLWISLPLGTEMFQFPKFASATYVFSYRWPWLLIAGFPHSDIFGLTLVSSSPKLFAEYHVLHRLLLPRHPPFALISLDHIISSTFYCSAPSRSRLDLFDNMFTYADTTFLKRLALYNALM